MERVPNPYLDSYLSAIAAGCGRDAEIWLRRCDLVEEYAYSIPNQEALDAITEFSPIVEIGAGTGYWALLLNLNGCRVCAFDTGDWTWKKRHYPIDNRDHRFGIAQFPGWTLMLGWPWGDTDEIIESYDGKNMVFIGEPHKLPNTDIWEVTRRIEIPSWPGSMDSVYLLRRQ